MTAAQDKIRIRMLDLSEIGRIQEIDRGEEIQESYRLVQGKLRLIATPESVSGFDPEELASIMERQKKIVNVGGAVLAAFQDDILAGVASVDSRMLAPGFCKMDILYISRPFRNRGLAVQLLQACKEKAKRYGASDLYISATPTRHTVDFYLRQGGRLLETPDPELFRMEPEDIHIGLKL